MPKKKHSIRKIVNILSSSQDLFRDTISEEYVVGAVHRWLKSIKDDRTKYIVLKACADTLASRGYPRISAAIMETAGQHFVNSANPSDQTWLESMSFASSYWLQAGDFEARQNSLLKSAGLAMIVTSQKSLFADDTLRENLSPLWELASDLKRDEQYGQAAAIYDALYSEMSLVRDFELAARSAILASDAYAHAEEWPTSVDRAKTAIEMATELHTGTRLLADAHMVAGISYMQYNPSPLIDEALRYLATAKDLYDEVSELSIEDRDRVHLWLGAAYAMQGELYLSDYYTNKLRSYLDQADRSYSLAIAYFEHMTKLPIRELGASCALLSIVCRELGEDERANELATKAMSYGFENED